MYLHHYGLAEPPFSITPDPRFVFLAERYRDALAHLRYGIEQGGGGGFVQLTGEVGTGKTTLSRLLLAQLPAHVHVALLLNPTLNPLQLLQALCEELGIDTDATQGDSKALTDTLNLWLLQAHAQGKRVVVVIDEAQNLSDAALEQVRLLTNLETDQQKLLQIVLLGQPELRDKLAQPHLRQLAQRITARFHLSPLAPNEVAGYLQHRWRVAGGQRFVFDAGAIALIAKRSAGIPRLVNVLAERALLAGYARDALVIDKTLAQIAANEVLTGNSRPKLHLWQRAAVISGAAALVLGLAWAWLGRESSEKTISQPSPASPADSTTSAGTASAAAVIAIDTDTAFSNHILQAGGSPLPAWKHLLHAWGLPANAIAVSADGHCIPAANTQLHCRAGRSNLQRLMALERPALLRLHSAGGYSWALLQGADARHVQIVLGDTHLQLPRGLLHQHWDGYSVSLWQSDAPHGSDEAAIRAWVTRQLARHQIAVGEDFNAAVAQFQRAHDLHADGLAGADTLMALTADLPGPRLLRQLPAPPMPTTQPTVRTAE